MKLALFFTVIFTITTPFFSYADSSSATEEVSFNFLCDGALEFFAGIPDNSSEFHINKINSSTVNIGSTYFDGAGVRRVASGSFAVKGDGLLPFDKLEVEPERKVPVFRKQGDDGIYSAEEVYVRRYNLIPNDLENSPVSRVSIDIPVDLSADRQKNPTSSMQVYFKGAAEPIQYTATCRVYRPGN